MDVGRALPASLLLSLASFVGCGDTVRIDLLAPEPMSIDAGRDADPGMDASLEAGLDAAASREDAGVALDAGDSGLILRYDFTGTDTLLQDRVGSANARVLGGAVLSDAGALQLDGVDDFVDMPNHTLDRLTDVTVVTWITWAGGVCWQRVFDFGRSTAGEGKQGDALASFFATLSTCPQGFAAAYLEMPRSIADAALSSVKVSPDRPLVVAVSFEGASHHLVLYLDGARVAEANTRMSLADLDDDNVWLGRSQWLQDNFARIRYDELRLYDRVLGERELAELIQRGPDRP